MISNNVADRDAIARIQAEVNAEVEAAVKFAIDAPYPSPDKVDQDIYA
jgi:TPP-dependent pyruvate/acetoin dehydrogenase alpha subunit